MRKVIVTVFVILLSGHAYAMSGTTKSGYAACVSEEYLDDFISFAVAKDYGSIQAYLDTQKCIELKQGLRVTVTDSPGMFGGKTGFVIKGIKLWTVREGLQYGN